MTDATTEPSTETEEPTEVPAAAGTTDVVEVDETDRADDGDEADDGDDDVADDNGDDDVSDDGDDADDASDDGDARVERSGDALLVQEGDIAADYLEQLLDIIDYDGDIDLDVENDRAVVSIVGEDLDALVGPRGEALDALQELTRLAVAQKTGTRSRLMLDISGHRAQRRQELTELATATARQVVADGESVRLSPMNPFERKVVHDAVASIDGVRSESEGEEPSRRVVVLPDAS